MKNVKITQAMIANRELLPEEMRPVRFAIASNFISCLRDIQTQKTFFLLFNYEPQKWNQWYPYFYSTNGIFDCHGKTYSELISEYATLQSIYPEINLRTEKAIAAISKLLGINDGITVQDSPIQTEYWIKYSKTQEVWTFYEIEFLQITQLPKVNFSGIQNIELMPLDTETINEVISSGMYKDVPVVDNTLEILKNKILLEKLQENVLLI